MYTVCFNAQPTFTECSVKKDTYTARGMFLSPAHN